MMMIFCCSSREASAGDTLIRNLQSITENFAGYCGICSSDSSSAGCHDSLKLFTFSAKELSSIGLFVSIQKAFKSIYLPIKVNDGIIAHSFPSFTKSPPWKFKVSVPLYLQFAVLRI
jgi:hypothetical protein